MKFISDIVSYLQSHIYFNNTLFNYIVAVLIFISIVFAITLLIPIEQSISNVFFASVIEIFRKRLIYISYAVAVYAALTYLTIPEKVTQIIHNAVMVYISIIVVLAITDILKNINTESLAKTGVNKIPAGILTLVV